MVISIEVLRKIKKRITVAFVIMGVIIFTAFCLSIIGEVVDSNIGISANNISSRDLYRTFGLLLTIIPFCVFITGIIRYVYLSYFEIDKLCFGKARYYPEFFILSMFVPVARFIYPYLYLNDLAN
jgi:hypothetical protein